MPLKGGCFFHVPIVFFIRCFHIPYILGYKQLRLTTVAIKTLFGKS